MIETIIKNILLKFSMPEADLKGKSQERCVVFLRYGFFYYLYKKNGWTLTQIGRYFNKNHATVHYGINEFQQKLEVNDVLAVSINKSLKQQWEACS